LQLSKPDVILWVLASVLYGAGDLITTLNNLRAGMVELNPLNVFAVKVLVFAAGVILYTRTREKMIPAILCILGGFAVLHNILVFYF